MFSSCINEDYKNIVKQGDPLIGVSSLGSAQMGKQTTFTVNCTDRSGERLSTLKAELLFTSETVDATTIRTKEAGDYTVTLNVPFLQYIPNGEATVRLTLQNVTTSTTIIEVPLTVERPHLSNLQFVTADNTAMTEVAEGKQGAYLVQGYDEAQWLATILHVLDEQPKVDPTQLEEYRWENVIRGLKEYLEKK